MRGCVSLDALSDIESAGISGWNRSSLEIVVYIPRDTVSVQLIPVILEYSNFKTFLSKGKVREKESFSLKRIHAC